MGKYSLENYYPYEIDQIRPRPLPDMAASKLRQTYQLLTFTWEELEPERGRFCLEHMTERLRLAKNPILKITKNIPAWLTSQTLAQEGFAHLLRKAGSVISQLNQVLGVMITSSEDDIREIDAYVDAFEPMSLLVPLEEEELITYLSEKKIAFGLVIHCSEDNWIDCCEHMAKLGIQNIWEQRPVVLEIEDREPGINIRRESLRWHASFANLPMEIGYRFSLRRLTYPKKIMGCGGLPLRFWFVNTGSSPCYQEFSLKLRLSKGKTALEFLLNIDSGKWVPGDIVYNEIVPLPELADGIYQISVGLVGSDGSWIQLAIDAKQESGFYVMGCIEVDSKLENNLLHAWDNFYPDGYYPLEDPQAPKDN